MSFEGNEFDLKTHKNFLSFFTFSVLYRLWMCVLLWKMHHYYLYSLYMNRHNHFDIAMQWFEKDSEEFIVEKEISRQAIGSIRAGTDSRADAGSKAGRDIHTLV